MAQLSNAVLRSEGADPKDPAAQALVWAYYNESPAELIYIGGKNLAKPPLTIAITTPKGALNEAGRKVAVVDERPYGGTWALRGCQPKKYLVANTEAVAMANHLKGIGIINTPQTDWPALQKLKNSFLDGKSEGEVKDFNKAGIATFFGKATFVGPDEVAVGEQRLKAKHIVPATGAIPRKSNFPGTEYTHDCEHFLNLPTLPKRIAFIGGGYISFEFAHVATRAGAQVTILHRSARTRRQPRRCRTHNSRSHRGREPEKRI